MDKYINLSEEEKIEIFNSLNDKPKVVYLLILCDLISENISDSLGYNIVEKALDKCWEWVKSEKVDIDQIYFYLENVDEQDIMTYMQLDKNNESVWHCIANGLAYIIKIIYQYYDEKYMPQTIECVDDKTIEDFNINFNKTYTNNDIKDKLLDYISTNYSDINNQVPIDISKIKQFIEDNI